MSTPPGEFSRVSWSSWWSNGCNILQDVCEPAEGTGCCCMGVSERLCWEFLQREWICFECLLTQFLIPYSQHCLTLWPIIDSLFLHGTIVSMWVGNLKCEETPIYVVASAFSLAFCPPYNWYIHRRGALDTTCLTIRWGE